MSLKITEWAAEDRPREKLVQKGTASLSDAELLAILISSGTREKSAVDLGRELLMLANNNLNALGKLSVSDLTRLRGINIGDTRHHTDKMLKRCCRHFSSDSF